MFVYETLGRGSITALIFLTFVYGIFICLDVALKHFKPIHF